MPSSGCTLTRPRAGAQTGRNKNNPRLPEIGGYIFAVNLYKLLSKGTRNFPKRQRKNQEWSRGARSTPFRSLQSQFRESPIHSVRRNKKILRYFLEFPGEAGRGAAWKRLCKNKKQAPEPLGGGACVFDSCVVLLSFLICPWITYPRALEFFQKGKSVIKSGRGALAPLRSARFKVNSEKVQFIPSGVTRKFCDIS